MTPPAPSPEDRQAAPAAALTLDDLRQNPQEHLRRLRETGEAERLTIDGEDSLVVVDHDAYERLLTELDRLDTIATLRERLAPHRQTRDISAEQFFDDFRRQVGLPRKGA